MIFLIPFSWGEGDVAVLKAQITQSDGDIVETLRLDTSCMCKSNVDYSRVGRTGSRCGPRSACNSDISTDSDLDIDVSFRRT